MQATVASLMDEVTDPTDWNNDFDILRNLDASLRCDLCFVGANHLSALPPLNSQAQLTLIALPSSPHLTSHRQDIYTSPVSIKSCHHTFCSTCIRTHINQSGNTGSFYVSRPE